MSKTAIILGSNSDIAKGLMPMLEADGWEVHGWRRGEYLIQQVWHRWDLFISAVGSVAPVGLWHKQDHEDMERNINSNLLLPIMALKDLWSKHNPGASVCFLAGSNPNMIMPGYFAYNVSKMALLKAVEQMDYETPDAKFFALGPGTILTKIHDATLKADWPNPKLEKELQLQPDPQPKIARVYECLKWCISQPKEVIGGRNICVSDPWDLDGLKDFLLDDKSMYKLRRYVE